jgi:hypothetical protein
MPYGYRGLKIFTSLSLRFQDFQRWAANAEGLTGDALKNFLDNELFPALQQLEAKGGVRIPVQSCHLFQTNAATHSISKLPLIPVNVATL